MLLDCILMGSIIKTIKQEVFNISDEKCNMTHTMYIARLYFDRYRFARLYFGGRNILTDYILQDCIMTGIVLAGVCF